MVFFDSRLICIRINENYSDYYGLMIKMQPKLLVDAMNGMGLIACKR
jgi:hypothetical protein